LKERPSIHKDRLEGLAAREEFYGFFEILRGINGNIFDDTGFLGVGGDRRRRRVWFFRAKMAIGSAPRIGMRVPSRDNSPMSSGNRQSYLVLSGPKQLKYRQQ
jgi:hypothetical protein